MKLVVIEAGTDEERNRNIDTTLMFVPDNATEQEILESEPIEGLYETPQISEMIENVTMPDACSEWRTYTG